jgi:GntR family transcriptional regulator / MocR family aminotransferase
MVEMWATTGIDLHLDRAGGKLRAGLEDALRDAVRTGRLAPGTRLPSSRSLAADMGIARNTVADAYGQLVAEGWLSARRGSSTRVADRVPALQSAASSVEAQASPPRYDLGAGSPDLSAFPRAAWLAAARRALNGAAYGAMGYGDPRGRPELRHALAGYLSRARGVRTDPERVVICSGFAQGLRLLGEVLRTRGAKTLAIEGFGHPEHRAAVLRAGLSLKNLALDAEGAQIGDIADADAALLTPAHQFPLGMALAANRRSGAVRWAQHSGAVIIEDDYDGEFRYDRQPVGALQALAPEHVIYAGTASKSLAPGIRLGWLVLPAHLIEDVVAAKALADRQTSTLDQLTLAEFIASGNYDRHVRRSRRTYARRRDRLVTILRRRVPAVQITNIAAGLHAVLELPAGQTEEEILTRAAEHGLAIEGLRGYNATGRPHRPALVVGYGTPPEHAFPAAVSQLCAVLNRPTGRPGRHRVER